MLLVGELRASLEPGALRIEFTLGDGATPGTTHSWPEPEADPGAALGVSGGLAHPAGQHTDEWWVVPIETGSRQLGSIALRGAQGPFAPIAESYLRALAAQTAIALESARLINVYDDGRRSWQEVVDALKLALCIVDGSGRIRRANRAFSALMNVPPAIMVGRPWDAFAMPEWRDDVAGLLDRADGAAAELRIGLRSFRVCAFTVGTGESTATVLLFEDETEARSLQEQLLQSAKLSAMGHLVAGVAHDLNNPLASVVGFADFLSELSDVPPNLREPLAVIREEAERASTIVRNLLSFARKTDNQRTATDLAELLESTMMLLRNTLMASRVDACLELEPDLPPVVVEASKVQQVFVNLVTNAAQAINDTGRPGTVTLRARRFLDGVAIEISDDGPGIAPEVASRIFDPFFTTKGEQRGTGLGLPICQGIVREHGGRITVESVVGSGATFTVVLPQGQPQPEPPTPDAVRPVTRRLRVLVVDDEPHILHYMRSTLEAWGHDVEVATDGEEALTLALTEQHDLILTDLRMLRLGGRELYEEIVRRAPRMAPRVFFSTGDTVRGDTLTFLESLDRPWLHKPFGLAELRALLSSAARAAHGRESGGFPVATEDATPA